MDRRQIIRLGSVLAVPAWLPRWAWSQVHWRSDPFTLGVASGSPASDSVVIWTRLESPELLGTSGSSHAMKPGVTVQWEVAHDAQFKQIVQRGQTQAVPELGFSVHVEVMALQPERWYFYRFTSGSARSRVGRTRTLPTPDAMVNRLRLGYASCQRWEHGFYSAWRHMRDEHLDLVMFLGDYIYEYPGALNPVRSVTGGWVNSLADYRQRHALYKTDPDLQAMHANCPWAITWDDHEVQNDYAGLQEGNGGPDWLNWNALIFSERRAAAYQAFYENMPLRSSVLTRALQGLAQAPELRIYNRFQYGQLATLNLLDARQYRSPQACTRNANPGASTVDPLRCDSWQDPSRTLLGDAQERWLTQSLQQSNAIWNVIAQQTLFGQRDLKTGSGQLLWNDSWDGYPAARRRLTDSLHKSAVPNPVIFGGDAHENWVGYVKADYERVASQRLGVEFCGTSISSRSGGNARTAERLAENPHFVFADAQRHGYGVAEFTTQAMTTSLRVVTDVTDQNSGIETLARFVVPKVQPGGAVIEKA